MPRLDFRGGGRELTKIFAKPGFEHARVEGSNPLAEGPNH